MTAIDAVLLTLGFAALAAFAGELLAWRRTDDALQRIVDDLKATNRGK